MPAPPQNPDLPSSYQVPGIYGYISLLGTGPSPLNRRQLILGYRTSAGTAAAGTPIRVNNEDDVVLYAGKGSDCHRIYRANQAQGAIGAETWLCPMTAPSGTAQTRLVTVLAMPSSDGHYGSSFGAVLDLDSKTGALAACIWTLWIEGYRCDCIVANGDTYATIATNMLAEIRKVEDYLSCTAGVGTATITLTGRHTALTSADLPVVSSFTNQVAAYLAASCGTLTYATTAGAGGVSLLYCATQSVSTTISNLDTAAVIAGAAVTAINAANAYPLAAAKAAAASALTLFYQNDRVVNWLATAITPAATITTTLTPAFGTAAAGLPSSSTPSLSQTLTNIAAVSDQVGAFKIWLTPFTGAGSYITDAAYTQTGSATEYSVLGTIAAHIESQGNGRNCKGQVVVLADSRALATAGAIPTSTSPALTSSPRYFLGWCPACPQQAYEIAARMAARIISQDFLPQNYAGMTLTTDAKVPLLLPHNAVAMTDSDANAAMLTYFMTPIRPNASNLYAIVSGRTTAKPGSAIDVRFAFFGTILTVDYFRDDLRAYFGATLGGKSIKRYGAPATANCTTPEAVRDLAYARMLGWEALDYFDGAERLRDYLQSGVNSFVPSRIDLAIPLAEPIPLEQISNYFMQVA